MGSRSDCAESNAEPPSDKERGNFCDWFSLDPRFRSSSDGEKANLAKENSAKDAFEDLFK
jgi:hypothetical protein